MGKSAFAFSSSVSSRVASARAFVSMPTTPQLCATYAGTIFEIHALHCILKGFILMLLNLMHRGILHGFILILLNFMYRGYRGAPSSAKGT